jgi:hypothetical protein
MPDNQDYADLGELLSRAERWDEADAERARLLRKHQASTAAEFDQRDRVRVSAMWAVVRQLDEAVARYEAAP